MGVCQKHDSISVPVMFVPLPITCNTKDEWTNEQWAEFRSNVGHVKNAPHPGQDSAPLPEIRTSSTVNVDGKTSKSIRHSPAWRGSSVGAWRMLAKPANEEIWISIVLQQSEILLIFFSARTIIFSALGLCKYIVDIKIRWESWDQRIRKSR